MVRRLSLGKNIHLAYYSLELNPQYLVQVAHVHRLEHVQFRFVFDVNRDVAKKNTVDSRYLEFQGTH